MPSIYFFPWLNAPRPLQYGDVVLEPYVRGEAPGDQPSVSQTDIDGLMDFYRMGPSEPLQMCLLIRRQDRAIGEHVSDDDSASFRLFAEILCCGSLSERSFFSHDGNYCSKDDFQLHGYGWPGKFDGHIVIPSRRRDGRALNLTDAEYGSYLRPHNSNRWVSLNENSPLLLALLSASKILPPKKWAAIYTSIANFNLANTDSSQITPDAELVLLYAGFQAIFGKLDDNSKAQALLIGEYLGKPPRGLSEMADTAIKKAIIARHGANTPKSILQLWLEDFRSSRGEIAHGQQGYRSTWSLPNHLALGSFLFPLLLKKHLQSLDVYRWTTRDQVDLQSFEHLIQYDHFDAELFGETRKRLDHPWYKARVAARNEAQSAELRKTLEEVIQKMGGEGLLDDE